MHSWCQLRPVRIGSWFHSPDQGCTIDVWGNVWLLSAFLFRVLTYLRILSDQQAGRGWAFVSRGTQALEENMCTLSTLNVSPAS